MDIKAIILDFDGVILESEGIKDQAFATLFKDYPQHLDEILSYHVAHGGTTRFEKFRYITEEILNQEYTPELKRKYSEEFAQFVYDRIISCPFVAGTLAFLEDYLQQLPLYVASVTPQEDLDKIIEARDLKKYFQRIYAAPWLKKDALKDILKIESISPQEAVFIGDTLDDYRSAQMVGVNFIGRLGTKSFNGADIPVFRDMYEIRNYLNTWMSK